MPYTLMLLEGGGLTGLGTVITQLFTWIGNLVTTIESSPLLLIPVGIFVGGAIIGLGHRLIRG